MSGFYCYIAIIALVSVLASAAGDTSSEWRLLKNTAYPGKCLHINADNGGNGAGLDMAPCDGNSGTQLVSTSSWLNVASGAGGEIHFKLGKCVTGPNDGNTANGIPAITWDCVGVGHQKYKLVGAQLQGANGKCLTAEGGGSYLDQWDCVNQPQQQWTLDTSPDWKLLKNTAYPGKCLHIVADNGGNGAQLDMAPCDGNSGTQLVSTSSWSNVASGAGGEIHFKLGKCVTGPNDGNTANGVPAITWDCVGVGHQKYKLVGAQLQGANGKCLTAEGGGSYLDQWDCVNQPQQQWNL